MIVSRYAVHKITGINESVFSQMWKRHLSGADFYGFFTDDGKVDISDPSFVQKYHAKIIPEELEKLKTKLEKKNNPKSKPVKKIKQKTETKPPAEKKKRGRPPKPKTETPVKVEKKTVTKKIEKPKNKPVDKPKDDEEKSELQLLALEATKAKHRKEIAQSKKAELDLRKARAELAEIDTIGKTCIGYLVALNQNLLDQPRSFIDELSAGIKSGKSKTDLTDIARKPAMAAIAETIDLLKKELARYKRDIKSENI